MEGNLRFKTDWASLIVGSKFTVFASFTLYLRRFSKYKPRGGLYFCVTGLGGLYLERLIRGGAYFRNFTVCSQIPSSLSFTCSE